MQSFIKFYQWAIYIPAVTHFMKFTVDCKVIGDCHIFESSIGTSDFKKAVLKKMPVVDKSPFLKELMKDRMEVLLITRPRRFGKSLALSMIKYFLTNAEETRELFKEFSVMEDKQFCEREQNQHPVIYLDFSLIKAGTYRVSLDRLKAAIGAAYSQHSYLENSKNLTQSEQRDVHSFALGDMSDTFVVVSIKRLCEYLDKHHRKRCIILLDEYDTGLINAFNYGFYDLFLLTLKGTLQEAFKNNQFLEKGVILGITVIGKESLFSAMSNVLSVTVAHESFSEYFGFLDEEVDQLLTVCNMTDLHTKEEVKRYYNGYHFGPSLVYNPWSIMMYIRNRKLASYWIESGSFKAFDDLVGKYGTLPRLKAEMLCDGINLAQTFDNKLVFSDIGKDDNTFWTLMTQLGYLTFNSTVGVEHNSQFECVLQIPNYEVKLEFERFVAKSRKKSLLPSYNSFVESILQNETDVASDTLSSFLHDSSFYPGENPFQIVIGLLRGLEPKIGQFSKYIYDRNENVHVVIMENCTTMSICSQSLLVATGVRDEKDLKGESGKKFLHTLLKKVGKIVKALGKDALKHYEKVIIIRLHHYLVPHITMLAQYIFGN